MATNTLQLQEALELLANQNASESWAQDNQVLMYVDEATGMPVYGPNPEQRSGALTLSGQELSNATQSLRSSMPLEDLFAQEGWQYDPNTQQVTTPWSEDNALADFSEFVEVPAIFGGLIAGAGAISGMMGGAGAAGDWASLGGGVDPGTTVFGGDGMTASLSEYAAPSQVLNSGAEYTADWASQGGGVDPSTLGGLEGEIPRLTITGEAVPSGNEGDWWPGSQEVGEIPRLTITGESVPGNEADWWTGMPPGTTEAIPGVTPIGNESDWWTGMPPGTTEAANGGIIPPGGLPPGTSDIAKALAKALTANQFPDLFGGGSGAFGQSGTPSSSSFMRKRRPFMDQPAFLGGGEQQWLGSAEDKAFNEAMSSHGEDVSNRAKQMASQLRGKPSVFGSFKYG